MFQLFQINWPPEDYDPEDDEIAKVYTNGGKVSCHHHDHHQHRHRYSHSKSSYDHHHHDDQAPTFTPAYPKTGPSPEKHGYYPGGDDNEYCNHSDDENDDEHYDDNDNDLQEKYYRGRFR